MRMNIGRWLVLGLVLGGVVSGTASRGVASDGQVDAVIVSPLAVVPVYEAEPVVTIVPLVEPVAVRRVVVPRLRHVLSARVRARGRVLGRVGGVWRRALAHAAGCR